MKYIFIVLAIAVIFSGCAEKKLYTLSDFTMQSADYRYCIKGQSCTLSNFQVTGNFSSKRPYLVGYDNTTQSLTSTTASQIVNISTVDDSYLINIKGRQNITFEQTGDYQLTFMPLLIVTSGSNKHIAFWIRKNGVDVPWSNTRIEIQAQNVEYAPSITYQFDIENTTNDYINMVWWSDTTNANIITYTGLVNPTRPDIPGVLILVSKVSEIT